MKLFEKRTANTEIKFSIENRMDNNLEFLEFWIKKLKTKKGIISSFIHFELIIQGHIYYLRSSYNKKFIVNNNV